MASRPKRTNRATTSKKQTIIGLLRRKNGATVNELIKGTGWQAHSVRGFLSGVLKKKLGLELATERNEGGDRRYWLKGRA